MASPSSKSTSSTQETPSCKQRKRSIMFKARGSDNTMSSRSSVSDRSLPRAAPSALLRFVDAYESDSDAEEHMILDAPVADERDLTDKTLSTSSSSTRTTAGASDCSGRSTPEDDPCSHFRGRLELMRRFYSWREIPMDFFVDSHVTVESHPPRKSRKHIARTSSVPTGAQPLPASEHGAGNTIYPNTIAQLA